MSDIDRKYVEFFKKYGTFKDGRGFSGIVDTETGKVVLEASFESLSEIVPGAYLAYRSWKKVPESGVSAVRGLKSVIDVRGNVLVLPVIANVRKCGTRPFLLCDVAKPEGGIGGLIWRRKNVASVLVPEYAHSDSQWATVRMRFVFGEDYAKFKMDFVVASEKKGLGMFGIYKKSPSSAIERTEWFDDVQPVTVSDGEARFWGGGNRMPEWFVCRRGNSFGGFCTETGKLAFFGDMPIQSALFKIGKAASEQARIRNSR